MTNKPSGPDQEEIRLLIKELADVKEVLQQNSRQLLRIERQLKALFPDAAPAPRNGNGRSTSTSKPANKRQPLDEPVARRVIDDLKIRASKGEQIEAELRGYVVKPDLQMLARILGMTNAKLPPKDELIKRISSRLRQSAAVTSGFGGLHEEASEYKTKEQ